MYFRIQQRILIGAVVVMTVVLASWLGACSSSSSEEQSLVEREIDRLEEAVAENPYNNDLRTQLALYYAEDGRYDEAIAQAQEVLQQNENHQGALMILGGVYLEQKRYEDAVEPYLKVVEMNEDNPMRGLNKQLQAAQYNLGEIYLELGEPEKAIGFLESTALANATDADSRRLLGEAYLASGEYEEAVEYFKKAILFVPKFKEAYEGLAICYANLGDEDGVTYAEAMINYCDANYAQAIEDLGRIVAGQPDFGEAQLGLGLAYEQVGNLDGAIEAYEAVVRLDPDHWFATARLNHLKSE